MTQLVTPLSDSRILYLTTVAQEYDLWLFPLDLCILFSIRRLRDLSFFSVCQAKFRTPRLIESDPIRNTPSVRNINSYDQWLRQSACSQTTSYLKYLITIEIFATTPLSLYGNHQQDKNLLERLVGLVLLVGLALVTF